MKFLRMACSAMFKTAMINKVKLCLHPYYKYGPRHCMMCKRHVVSSFLSYQKSDKSRQITPNKVQEKIVFNSKLSLKLPQRFNKTVTQDSTLWEDTVERPPILALKYFEENNNDPSNINKPSSDEPVANAINLPFRQFDNVAVQENIIDSDIEEFDEHRSDRVYSDSPHHEYQNLSFTTLKDKHFPRITKNWMKGYNKYPEISLKMSKEEQEDEEEEFADGTKEKIKFGSEDSSISSSSVPCGGCGAHLHCQDSAIPGFLPKEIFQGLSDSQLQGIVCQRCHFLQEYNTALSVNVDPKIYPQLLSQIKGQVALVILVVDMTDFPCSIWPGILDIIGPKRPLVVVGNKIDLLQDTGRDWLTKAKTALIKQLPPKANILDVSLISAKTGYGIEQLISTLYNVWEYRGDVYLVGCTNVGKSTLFNTLLQSDYCKTKAVNLLQRATTAPWPGTTLNLLKFPIMRPQGWRLAMRSLRLKTDGEAQLKQIQEGKPETTPQMISVINRTFSHGMTDRTTDEHADDPFAMPKMATLRRLQTPNSGLDPKDPVFAKSKWLYDTPGVITSDQIIDLLTTEELMKTLPKEPMLPRSFTVWAGQSLLIGGLARLDYIKGDNNIKMTVLSSKSLPVTICFTQDVDEVYEYYLGSEVLAVPCGSVERLEQWPGLAPAPPFVLKGEGWKESCADVVLSSAGWIAVTGMENCMSQLQAWTPDARGIHVRMPPVLPRAIAMKGRRMYKSQAYALYNEYAQKMLKNS